jgi:hypothetical protein
MAWVTAAAYCAPSVSMTQRFSSSARRVFSRVSRSAISAFTVPSWSTISPTGRLWNRDIMAVALGIGSLRCSGLGRAGCYQHSVRPIALNVRERVHHAHCRRLPSIQKAHIVRE